MLIFFFYLQSPMIVMGDCDLEKTVAGALAAMRFTRQGQSCTAASRMFVHESVYDQFVSKMAAAVDKMVMGDPLDLKTDIGTIISKAQYDKVKSYIALGEKMPGVKAIHCSKLPTDPHLKDGFFIRPVIFTEIDNTCTVSREEIFGPVTSVIRFSNFEDAIRMANDTDYGLAASIWTRDLKTALLATKQLKAGVVQVKKLKPRLSFIYISHIIGQSKFRVEPEFSRRRLEIERAGSRSLVGGHDRDVYKAQARFNELAVTWCAGLDENKTSTGFSFELST